MIYVPENIDPIELLKRCGFFKIKNGWSRPQWNKNRKTPPTEETLIRRRMHAFVVNNTIDFHYDMPVSKKKKHQAQNRGYGKGGKQVLKMFREFEALDYKKLIKPYDNPLRQRTNLTP